MRANNYVGYGEYMTEENRRGIVLLVTDGDDYETIQAEERKRQERQRIADEQEIQRRAEEKERQRKAALKA